MDPTAKDMEAAIKMMNDQAQYELRRNVYLAVLLYFGRSFLTPLTVAPLAWDSVAVSLGLH
jgi:hypothetical protein